MANRPTVKDKGGTKKDDAQRMRESWRTLEEKHKAQRALIETLHALLDQTQKVLEEGRLSGTRFGQERGLQRGCGLINTALFEVRKHKKREEA